MADEGEKWFVVKNHSELKVGMSLELRPCTCCNKTRRFIILSEHQNTGLAIRLDGAIRPSSVSKMFTIAGGCPRPGSPFWIFDTPIAERRLYRLADPPGEDTGAVCDELFASERLAEAMVKVGSRSRVLR
jgi:hypothetical protein